MIRVTIIGASVIATLGINFLFFPNLFTGDLCLTGALMFVKLERNL